MRMNLGRQPRRSRSNQPPEGHTGHGDFAVAASRVRWSGDQGLRTSISSSFPPRCVATYAEREHGRSSRSRAFAASSRGTRSRVTTKRSTLSAMDAPDKVQTPMPSERLDMDEEPSGSEQRASRLIRTLSIAGAVVIGLLAGYQLVTRGTSSVTSLSPADYRARSEAGNGQAPDFTLPTLSGEATLTLRSFRGSVVVLNFWASWCAPCIEEAPDLERVAVAYRSQGVRFLGVDERDDPAAARAFQREFEITYPSVFDPAGSLADDYRLVGLPTTFVISRDGRLLYKFTGFLDKPTLTSTLEAVLATGTT